MKRILIRGGYVVDPATGINGVRDILVEKGKITDVRKAEGSAVDASKTGKDEKKTGLELTVKATGMVVSPGLIDMHTHLREPGHEYKETIASGCLAAAQGGFSSVCCMPNTDPVNDNQSVTDLILKKAKDAIGVRVYPVGAISRGLKGERLAEYGEMKASGVVAVSDDGNPVMNSQLMRRALEYAKGFGLPVIAHCEDLHLTANGSMNEGVTATRLGLAGIPNASETVMVARDIALCELTETPIHIAHVSAAGSVQLIRDAKKRGLPLTAETTPHYFTLTEEAVIGYNANAKVNPPLRSERDRQAVLEGLVDGTIDVIASDHAPHSTVEKDVEFEFAANGLIGLETSLPLSLALVEKAHLELPDLIAKMSVNPAKILQRDHVGLAIGNPADLTIIDLNKAFTVDANAFCSKSRNTPFDGWQVKGKAVMTMVAGDVLFNDSLEVMEIH